MKADIMSFWTPRFSPQLDWGDARGVHFARRRPESLFAAGNKKAPHILCGANCSPPASAGGRKGGLFETMNEER
jgi:hypothetical protein